MPRRVRKPNSISIPISSFETIAERTKSANKRQSKPPQRFDNEFKYFPKMTLKKEYNYLFNPSKSGSARKHRNSSPNRRVKKEVAIPSTPLILNLRTGLRSDNFIETESNGNHFNIFGSQVSTSTPKSVANQTSEPLYQTIPYLNSINGTDSYSMSSLPPKLVPIDESETEIEYDLEDNRIPPPPTLQPIYQFNDFEINMGYINAKQINTSKRDRNEKNVSEFKLLKTNRELDEMKRRYSLSVKEMQRHKQEMIGLKELNNTLKEDVYRLKQKVVEESTRHKLEVFQIKRKHWCSVCLGEAQYYCCWVGSYCSQKCQQIHWKQSHKSVCRR